MNEQAVAWRCENCRRWQPQRLASFALLVDDIAEGWYFVGAVKRRRRFSRLMVVCEPCRRSIVGDLPGATEGGQSE